MPDVFITKSSEPGKQSALKLYLVGKGRSESRGRVGPPLGNRAGAPSWNPEAPGAGPEVSPWQPTDLSSLLERPQLPASWGPHFHMILCVITVGSPGEREKGAKRE